MAIRKRWAFLVGINRYTDYSSLNYCVDDVLALKEMLSKANYTVVCLHDRQDRDDPEGTPNRCYPTVNIRAEFENLCSAIRQREDASDDLLLVYFACHGTSCAEQPRLVANDTRKSLLDKRAISIDELEQGMANSGAGRRVLMLDACHIGLGRGPRGSRSRAPENSELLNKIYAQAKGYALLSASTDQQDAHEWEGVKHGVFSFYVLLGLSGEAALQGDRKVTVGNLAGYIEVKLQAWQVNHGVSQAFVGRTEGSFGNFPLIDDCQGLKQLVEAEPSNQESQRQGVQSRGRSPAELIEALWSLNCDDQCQAFRAKTPRSQRAAAFVVQAKDSRIQHWLVKRLVKQIPNVANARVFAFGVPTHPMWKRRKFEELWTDLASELRCLPDKAAVIDSLVKLYRTKPIIIAMYGWSSMRRSQALQQEVLSELWQPLVEAVGALAESAVRSRIILFLAEGPKPQPPSADPLAETNSAMPIRLAPLTELTSRHIADWMESDTVYSKLEQRLPPEEIAALIDKDIFEWDCDPAAAIEQICYIFELENGIGDIEAEWRLAG